MLYLKIFTESVRQAFQQLISNKLRSFLSLLGITIGIWCVIVVLSAVDSLERSIMNSFQELGDDVVYVSKMPWNEDPKDNYWKYMRRPNTGYTDYKALKKRVNLASAVSYCAFLGPKNLEYRSFNVSNVFVLGATYDFSTIFNLEFEEGRYYSHTEYQAGTNQIVVGYEVAQKLFPSDINPVGKRVKLMGQKFQIIGVLAKEGQDLINPLNFDELIVMSYNSAKNFVNTKRSRGGMLNVKAKEGITLDQLKGDITTVMRGERRLKPIQKDNFSLNTLSIITNLFKGIFSVISAAGWLIGIFSILVGGFGVANIMFVSVKERTNIIGIKKALGARQGFILTEFLIESIILCVIGGIAGLLLVYLAAQIGTKLSDFEFVLSFTNIAIGLSASIIIGVVAGFIPALQASRLDPVVAIRG